MGPPSSMRSVVARNVVMWRIPLMCLERAEVFHTEESLYNPDYVIEYIDYSNGLKPD